MCLQVEHRESRGCGQRGVDRMAQQACVALLSRQAQQRCSKGAAQHSTHRKLRECGQMGVNRMAGTEGCTMDPPAATL